MTSYKLVDLKTLGDDRGSLIAIEQGYNTPFEIKRVYYIFDTKEGVERGFHAHINLKQIAIAVKGSSAYVAKMIIENGKVVFENANIPHTYGELKPSNFTRYPKNPSIAKVFREIGFADELGSGVKNLYKYSKAYGGSDPLITEGEVFKIEVKTTEQNINGGINELCNFIKENEGLSAVALSERLNTSLRTIQRWIKQLKDEDKIVYKGSKKTGGYAVR